MNTLTDLKTGQTNAEWHARRLAATPRGVAVMGDRSEPDVFNRATLAQALLDEQQSMPIEIKTAEEIEKMRVAGRLAAYIVIGLVVCGVGTGGPMTRGGATVSPINIHAWRDYFELSHAKFV